MTHENEGMRAFNKGVFVIEVVLTFFFAKVAKIMFLIAIHSGHLKMCRFLVFSAYKTKILKTERSQ